MVTTMTESTAQRGFVRSERTEPKRDSSVSVPVDPYDLVQEIVGYDIRVSMGDSTVVVRLDGTSTARPLSRLDRIRGRIQAAGGSGHAHAADNDVQDPDDVDDMWLWQSEALPDDD